MTDTTYTFQVKCDCGHHEIVTRQFYSVGENAAYTAAFKHDQEMHHMNIAAEVIYPDGGH